MYDRKRTSTIWMAILGLLCIARLSTALEDPIQLKSGKISGTALEHDIRVYKGVPFAAPPVGDLRWRPPQRAANWEGVRACDKFSATAMQGRGNRAGAAESTPGMSEDCLYLNVWTPAKTATESLPVMVWIHGGGWSTGSGSVPVYNGEPFAQKGVVLVTINYRLGAFGFFAHPLLTKESERGVSGNYGLLDQIAALKWVQDNIAAFGGNPKNVTIFGESAGGSSVYMLVASPLAKGLFEKAISESAWVTDTNVTDLKKKTFRNDSAEEIGEKAAKAALGDKADGGLAALRALSAEDVLTKLRVQVSAAVDGWFLPKLPAEIYAEGLQNKVSLIGGTNNAEGTMFAGREKFETIEAYREARKKQLGDEVQAILKLYPAEKVDDIRGADIAFISDSWFIRPTREMVRGMAKAGMKTYMYHFTRNPRDPAAGANHAGELAYVFKRLKEGQAEPADLKLSEAMNTYWTQFAKTGDPNGNGQPEWPAFDLKTERYIEFGDPIKAGSNLRKERLDALDKLIAGRKPKSGAPK